MEIDVGHVVNGKYELLRLLGRGSMGEVWAAHHLTLGEKLALKLLTKAPEGDELESASTAAARFQFEAQVAARLSRKTRHIVRVTDHGEEDGLAYLVMELLEGETLEAALVRDQRVPLATMTKIVTQVAKALEHAHAEGVLHRDLKPANVFLSHDEEGKLLVKLLDFGIARAIHSHRVGAFSTAKGLVFGTPSYMSPEQARASSKLDHRCDLWALATIAFEGLSGELPINGEDADELLENLCAHRMISLQDRAPGMPPALDAFFRRAFSPAVGARFQSATELAQAFARAAASGSERHAATDPPGVPTPSVVTVTEAIPQPPKTRWSRAAVATTVLAGVVLLGLAVGWRALAGSPPEASADSRRPESTHTATVAAAPPASSASPLPSAALELPPVAFSSLPRVDRRAGRPPSTPAASTASSAPPATGPTPAPTLAPAPPPKKVDKSEVF